MCKLLTYKNQLFTWRANLGSNNFGFRFVIQIVFSLVDSDLRFKSKKVTICSNQITNPFYLICHSKKCQNSSILYFFYFKNLQFDNFIRESFFDGWIWICNSNIFFFKQALDLWFKPFFLGFCTQFCTVFILEMKSMCSFCTPYGVCCAHISNFSVNLE